MTKYLQRMPAMSSAGFTLAEIMVAMFILTGAVLSGTFFFASMARSAAFTGHVAQATELAQDKLEELLEQTKGTMAAGNDTIDGFDRTWTLSNNTDFAVLEVTVDWNSLDGKTRSVSLDTLRAH
ncbi:MAG: prepilin-type N-terminal cleavage/methylation domain-containing protein [Kiritimatiellae bacterium]|nr:prepilin-type N-terminal cleavage/methylation domain-containing protein [Kiritimatiellia bacterium]